MRTREEIITEANQSLSEAKVIGSQAIIGVSLGYMLEVVLDIRDLLSDHPKDGLT